MWRGWDSQRGSASVEQAGLAGLVALLLLVGIAAVAAIARLELTGSTDEQAMQVRDAIRIVFPESVTLVREAREGLS